MTLPLFNCHMSYTIQKGFKEKLNLKLNKIMNYKPNERVDYNLTRQISHKLSFYIPILDSSFSSPEIILNNKVVSRIYSNSIGNTIRKCVVYLKEHMLNENLLLVEDVLLFLNEEIVLFKKKLLNIPDNILNLLYYNAQNKNCISVIFDYIIYSSTDSSYDNKLRIDLKYFIFSIFALNDLIQTRETLLSLYNDMEFGNNGHKKEENSIEIKENDMVFSKFPIKYNKILDFISLFESLNLERPLRLQDERFMDDCLL